MSQRSGADPGADDVASSDAPLERQAHLASYASPDCSLAFSEWEGRMAELLFGIIGAAAGIGGIVFGIAGSVRSGEALRETRRNPVRQAQHLLLPKLSDQAKRLDALLEAVNRDVQAQPSIAELLQDHASKLRSVIQLMNEPTFVDRELRRLLAELKETVSPSQDDPDSRLAGQLDRFANLCAEIARAKQRRGDSSGVRQNLIDPAIGVEHVCNHYGARTAKL
jgi:hypothetical protein